jgi:hypothetical protein
LEGRIGDQPETEALGSPETASRFEPRDVPPLLPLWLGLLLAAFIGAVLLTIDLGYPLATHQQSRGPLQPLPSSPRLETAPHRDLEQYEAAKRKELRSSIDAAMKATAEQGWGPPK